MLGTLAGFPGQAFVAVAVWTVISLAFHALRIAQAEIVTAQGGTVRSWLSEPEGGSSGGADG
jgi:hypothetical protein